MVSFLLNEKYSHRTPVGEDEIQTLPDRRPIPIHFKIRRYYFCFILPIFREELLSLVEQESFLRLFPLDVLKKGLNIVSSLKTVVDHKSVLKNIHDENGHSP